MEHPTADTRATDRFGARTPPQAMVFPPVKPNIPALRTRRAALLSIGSLFAILSALPLSLGGCVVGPSNLFPATMISPHEYDVQQLTEPNGRSVEYHQDSDDELRDSDVWFEPFADGGTRMNSLDVSEQTTVEELVVEAQLQNPELRRLRREAAAAWERVPQVRSLPDPMLGTTVFASPMMMADGETTATLMVSQMLPSLARLDAQGQRVAVEALALEQTAAARELEIAAEIRELWYRRYFLVRQLDVAQETQRLIESLTEIATHRVEVGEATVGDVLLATLELGRVAEEQLVLRQQLASNTAMLNRLLGRAADESLPVLGQLDVDWQQPPLDELRAAADAAQPEIALARLEAQAASWGIRVAALQRRPDLTVSYEHMFMRPTTAMHGGDPIQLGVAINVPIWRRKYDAMLREAQHEYCAARDGVDEVVLRYDALIFDLVQRARAADRVASLYRDTILPQARQTLEADQRAYAQGQVQFDRVIDDVRAILEAEVALARALTDLAIALARLEQATGTPLAPLVARLRLETP